jgi:hypothetical protein
MARWAGEPSSECVRGWFGSRRGRHRSPKPDRCRRELRISTTAELCPPRRAACAQRAGQLELATMGRTNRQALSRRGRHR